MVKHILIRKKEKIQDGGSFKLLCCLEPSSIDKVPSMRTAGQFPFKPFSESGFTYCYNF
jgi:hypothetical protein